MKFSIKAFWTPLLVMFTCSPCFQIVNLLTDRGFFMLHKGTPRKERLPNQVEDRIVTIHALARDETKVKDFKKPY